MKLLSTSVRASEGIAVGRAFVVRRTKSSVNREKGSAESEKSLFATALAASREQIAHLAENSDIFAAHLEIIDDEMIVDSVEMAINEGCSAEDAVSSSCEQIVSMFEAMDDEYLAARAADVKDIFARISQNLAGGVINPFEGVENGDIVVDRELFPSDMALLDFSKIRGFVTAEGSTTSHVCIMARNLSLPAVVGLGDATAEITTGDRLIIDGAEGLVIVNPDEYTLNDYLTRGLNYQALKQEQQAVANCEIFDGDRRVYVFANAGSVEDVERAIASGADGIGLFRSEFVYMQSSQEPTEDKQYEIYAAAARACSGKPLIIRTLDIGGDKAVPYLDFPKEENPFLGWRAIRISLDRVDMFCRQLRAILRASTDGDVRVMFPMVVCVEELRDAKYYLEQCKRELEQGGVAFNPNIKVGVMIETPASVFIADSLAAECDFFSIGTNDLIQYIMAADRANVKVSKLYNPYSDAVLRAVQSVILAAQNANIECGMCGELASDNLATERLLTMGLNEFSVNVGSIAKIKYELNKLTTK